jgi:hypothetical protein
MATIRDDDEPTEALRDLETRNSQAAEFRCRHLPAEGGSSHQCFDHPGAGELCWNCFETHLNGHPEDAACAGCGRSNVVVVRDTRYGGRPLPRLLIRMSGGVAYYASNLCDRCAAQAGSGLAWYAGERGS